MAGIDADEKPPFEDNLGFSPDSVFTDDPDASPTAAESVVSDDGTLPTPIAGMAGGISTVCSFPVPAAQERSRADAKNGRKIFAFCFTLPSPPSDLHKPRANALCSENMVSFRRPDRKNQIFPPVHYLTKTKNCPFFCVQKALPVGWERLMKHWIYSFFQQSTLVKKKALICSGVYSLWPPNHHRTVSANALTA